MKAGKFSRWRWKATEPGFRGGPAAPQGCSPARSPRRRADHSAGLRAPAELLSAAPACVIANADLPADHGWSQASTAIETRDVVHGKPDPMHRFRNAAIERRRNSICGGRAPALGASIRAQTGVDVRDSGRGDGAVRQVRIDGGRGEEQLRRIPEPRACGNTSRFRRLSPYQRSRFDGHVPSRDRLSCQCGPRSRVEVKTHGRLGPFEGALPGRILPSERNELWCRDPEHRPVPRFAARATSCA